MSKNHILSSEDKLTKLAKSNGIDTWNELTEFVKNLPYGRNKNRTDFGLVLSEKKGTCSSKHALLKSIAKLNNLPHIKLIIGIYRMTELNTPKIGNELTKNSIDFIPEAHCYLKIDNKRIDFTSKKADFHKIEKDIIQEKEIEPHQVVEFKVDHHKKFLKNWIKDSNSLFEFHEIWAIREKCIENLTKQS